MDQASIDARIPVPGTQHSTKGLFAWWVAAHMTIALLGATIASALFATRSFGFVIVCVLFGSVAQETVLSYYLPNTKRAQWTLATIVGALLGFIIGFFCASAFPYQFSGTLTSTSEFSPAPITAYDIRELFRYTLIFFVAGTITGLSQTLVLQQYGKSSRGNSNFNVGWLFSVSASWALGALVTATTNLALLGGWQMPGPGSESTYEISVQISSLFLGMVAASIVTGLALTRLLNNPLFLTQAIEDEEPQPRILKRSGLILFSVLSLVAGLFWLWIGINLIESSFRWPYDYHGPGVTSQGPPPDEFFINARVLSVSIVAISLAYLAVTIISLAITLRRPRFVAEDPWRRYWAIALSSFVILWLSCFWLLGTWFIQYTD